MPMNSELPSLPAVLLGIDLEPLPFTDPDRPQSWTDLCLLTRRLLVFLQERRWRATFFIVGEVVARCPELLEEIRQAGHEMACHTHSHRRLKQYAQDDFKRDLESNLEAVRSVAGEDVTGFRAPFFSLTERTAWVYEILASFGIRYSSSVSEFRDFQSDWSLRAIEVAKRHGIVELPIATLAIGPVAVPLGGLYWRCCPESLLVEQMGRIATRDRYASTFFHAHDFHCVESTYVGAGTLLRNPLFGPLMLLGRRSVETKLARVASMGFRFRSFQGYLDEERLRAQPAPVLAGIARY